MINTQTVLCSTQDKPPPLYHGLMGVLCLEATDPDFDPFKTLLRAFIQFAKYRHDLTESDFLEHAIEALERTGRSTDADTLRESRAIIDDDILTYLLLGINGDSATPIDLIRAAFDIYRARVRLRKLKSGRARSIVLSAAFMVTGAVVTETKSSQDLSKAVTEHALASISQLRSLSALHPAAILVVALEVINRPEVLQQLTAHFRQT